MYHKICIEVFFDFCFFLCRRLSRNGNPLIFISDLCIIVVDEDKEGEEWREKNVETLFLFQIQYSVNWLVNLSTSLTKTLVYGETVCTYMQ